MQFLLFVAVVLLILSGIPWAHYRKGPPSFRERLVFAAFIVIGGLAMLYNHR